MYEIAIQSSLTERFAKGTKKRMQEDIDREKALKYLVTYYILNHIDHKLVD